MKTSRPEVLLITNNNKLLDRFHSFSAFKTTVIYMKLAQEHRNCFRETLGMSRLIKQIPPGWKRICK